MPSLCPASPIIATLLPTNSLSILFFVTYLQKKVYRGDVITATKLGVLGWKTDNTHMFEGSIMPDGQGPSKKVLLSLSDGG